MNTTPQAVASDHAKVLHNPARSISVNETDMSAVFFGTLVVKPWTPWCPCETPHPLCTNGRPRVHARSPYHVSLIPASSVWLILRINHNFDSRLTAHFTKAHSHPSKLVPSLEATSPLGAVLRRGSPPASGQEGYLSGPIKGVLLKKTIFQGRDMELGGQLSSWVLQ